MFSKAYAQTSPITPIVNKALPNFAGKTPEVLIGTLISGIVAALLVMASFYAFFQLLLGGLNWISSSGDKGKLEAAQNRITQAVVGLFVVFAAWAIFLFLLKFLGVITDASGAIKLKLPTIF